MRHLAFYFRGAGDHAVMTALRDLYGFPESTVLRAFVEAEPINVQARPALDLAKTWCRGVGAGLVIVDLKGLGRVQPFLTALAAGGVPLYFPQVPTMPSGKPLDRSGIRELGAWNDMMKSQKFREAARPGTGGDQGYKPPADATAKAREAKTAEAQGVALDRGDDVINAYTQAGSFNGAAKLLNEAGVKTLSGTGTWHSQTVRRTLVRLGLVS
jgi:hypothetical protein